MKRMILTAALGLWVAAAGQAQQSSVVPTLINYQGKLVDSAGDLLPTGDYTLVFNIFDKREDPANQVWGPQTFGDGGTQPAVRVVNGYFNVTLGPFDEHEDGEPAPRPIKSAFMEHTGWPAGDVTWQDERFLEITLVGDTDEALRRQQILTTPYAVRAENEVPHGTITMFAGPSANIPDGWLLCDGSPVASADYAELWDAIGTYWGTGKGDADPNTDFNVPDLQGLFLRGRDYAVSPFEPARGSDTGPREASGTGAPEDVGSVEVDSQRNHKHDLGDHEHAGGDLYVKMAFTSNAAYFQQTDSHAWNQDTKVTGITYQSGLGSRTEGIDVGGKTSVPYPAETGSDVHEVGGGVQTETRPKCVYVNYIIKH